jgi:hypothetical protein
MTELKFTRQTKDKENLIGRLLKAMVSINTLGRH